MNTSCCYPRTLLLAALALTFTTLTPRLFGQNAAGTQPVATAPATVAPATAPGGRNMDPPLPTNKVQFDFSNEPIANVVAYVARSFNFRLIDPYKLQQTITMKFKEPLGAKDAIDILDQSLLALGYTVQRETIGNPPIVQLRVTTASQHPGLRVFNGIDPTQIPDNDELRTQVIPLTHVDPEKARQLVVPVLDQKADITVNAGSKTLIITDTNSRIRTAVSLLQVLEKQATEKSPPAASNPAR